MRLAHHRGLHWLRTFLCVVALAIQVLAQEPPPIQYVYDDLGRLIKVIDQGGNMAEYVYDAVGNILEIRCATITGLAILSLEIGVGLPPIFAIPPFAEITQEDEGEGWYNAPSYAKVL